LQRLRAACLATSTSDKPESRESRGTLGDPADGRGQVRPLAQADYFVPFGQIACKVAFQGGHLRERPGGAVHSHKGSVINEKMGGHGGGSRNVFVGVRDRRASGQGGFCQCGFRQCGFRQCRVWQSGVWQSRVWQSGVWQSSVGGGVRRYGRSKCGCVNVFVGTRF
jgi:hypothetical protein